MTNPHAFPLEPTPIHVSDEVLDDLRARLALTRAPLDEGNGDWSYGVADSYLRGLVGYTTNERVRAFKTSPQADWFNHVNVNAHDHGGHFIPWENPDAWVRDLRRTFHGRRP
jgi:hypothetical protein